MSFRKGSLLYFTSLVWSIFILGCKDNIFENDLPKILGIEKVTIEKSNCINEFGGFGEGYILEVYEFSENTIQAFKSETNKKLPEKSENGINWEKYGWKSTPIDSSYNEIFIMGLNYFSGNEKLEVQLNYIKQILLKQDVYYSFYYKPDSINPQNVQIFIFDIQSRKLYAIDSSI